MGQTEEEVSKEVSKTVEPKGKDGKQIPIDLPAPAPNKGVMRWLSRKSLDVLRRNSEAIFDAITDGVVDKCHLPSAKLLIEMALWNDELIEISHLEKEKKDEVESFSSYLWRNE